MPCHTPAALGLHWSSQSVASALTALICMSSHVPQQGSLWKEWLFQKILKDRIQDALNLHWCINSLLCHVKLPQNATAQLTYLFFHGFYGSQLCMWLTWLSLDQGFLWSCRQAVRQGCGFIYGLSEGGRGPTFKLTCVVVGMSWSHARWASLSQTTLWLPSPAVSDPRESEKECYGLDCVLLKSICWIFNLQRECVWR